MTEGLKYLNTFIHLGIWQLTVAIFWGFRISLLGVFTWSSRQPTLSFLRAWWLSSKEEYLDKRD
jgi:hypothetical protein